MTNWSDETVEKVARVIHGQHYAGSYEALPEVHSVCEKHARDIIAAVTECREVRELVEAAEHMRMEYGNALVVEGAKRSESALYTRLAKALRPFTGSWK